MEPLTSIQCRDWDSPVAVDVQDRAIDAIESGRVLVFNDLPFAISESETPLISPATAGQAKNVSWDGARRTLKGTSADAADADRLRGMLQRFASSTQTLLRHVLSPYADRIIPGRTSFRPVEAAGRTTSWRKDDTRLHVDSFPSNPVRGRRILRVFSNVNPLGRPRTWKLGGDFEETARRFLPSLTPPWPGSAALLRLLSVTKSRRTEYDHYMLQLHDRMKSDPAYQAGPGHVMCDFAAGSTWAVFTDQAPHAALGGQFLLEQTFYVPVEVMREPARSPLRVLERLMGRKLV
ncbi:MAG: Kdo hydroxylase family protein [Phycisphaerales bacterium]